MSGFADLVKQAKPALAGEGFDTAGTQGCDWEWRFKPLTDDAGDAIDLSTGITATAVVAASPGATPLVTLTFTGSADGTFTLSADDTATSNLVTGTGRVNLCWSLAVSDSASGKDVQFWLASNSTFVLEVN